MQCDVVLMMPTPTYRGSALSATSVCGCRDVDGSPQRSGGKYVCFHAGATGHRPRATDGVDHDTQSHRFGQQGTNTGFEGRLEARTEMDELPWTQVLGFPREKSCPIRSLGRLPVGLGSSNKNPVPALMMIARDGWVL